MAFATFTSRTARTTFHALAFGVATTLALGACGSQAQTEGLAGSARTTAGSDVKVTTGTFRLVKTGPSAAPPAALAAPGSDTLKYVKIVEPFSPPGRCRTDGTTIEMTSCVLRQVVKVDRGIDRLQRRRFQHAPTTAQQKADLQDDARWLRNRSETCLSNPIGGSIDQILHAQCLLKISRQRLGARTPTLTPANRGPVTISAPALKNGQRLLTVTASGKVDFSGTTVAESTRLFLRPAGTTKDGTGSFMIESPFHSEEEDAHCLANIPQQKSLVLSLCDKTAETQRFRFRSIRDGARFTVTAHLGDVTVSGRTVRTTLDTGATILTVRSIPGR